MKSVILLLSLIISLTTKTYALDVNLKDLSDKFINDNISSIKAAGTTIAVIKGNEIINHKSFGKRDVEGDLLVNARTLFRIGSLTKTFTASSIMILRNKGLLKLDDPVAKYIPELNNIRYPYAMSPVITIRHLVTHSSGLILQAITKDLSITGLINEIITPSRGSIFIQGAKGMFWYPGYEYRYSNLGIAILGEVVTRISQRPIREFIKEEILIPLEMNHTYWHESELPQNIRSYSYEKKEGAWNKRKDWDLQGYSAAGSMYSNITDLAKWMALQFKNSPGSGPTILTPFIIEEMHRVQAMWPSHRKVGGTGITWYTTKVDGRAQVGHSGATGGYTSFFTFSKKHQIGVIVLASNGRADVDSFGEKLLLTLQKSME
jgi:CubicO group peptidase (beta-lactamase class C family)